MGTAFHLALFGLCLAPLALAGGEVHEAAKKGDVAAVAAALDAGADVNASDGSAPPLYHAVRRGRVAVAELLLARGADVNATSARGPALFPAAARGRADLVRLLLDGGADPDTAYDGVAVIHAAAEGGCLDCVAALMEAGADANLQTADGETALHLARKKGYEAVAVYLLAHGAVIPRPAPIGPMLGAADAERGRVLVEAECGGCHYFDGREARRIGPTLWDIVGRAKASVANVGYSPALKAWGGTWTYEDLNTWLCAPRLTVPGVFMDYGGIADDAARADAIAYLRTLSDAPAPLP